MDSYGFPDVPLDGRHTSIDAHAHFHHGGHLHHIHDEQQQQQQHLQYGPVQFPTVVGFSAEHMPADGIATLSHHGGYHNTHDYGQQGHTHSLLASPHVNRYHNLHLSSSSSSSPPTFPSFCQPSVSGLTMTYGDAGSNFQAADGSGSDPLPQLRPQDVGDDVPAAPSNFGQVQYERSSDQAGRQDEEQQANQRVQDGGSPAGVDGEAESETGSKACKYVVDPPNLAEWRQRLFDLEETVVMTNTE